MTNKTITRRALMRGALAGALTAAAVRTGQSESAATPQRWKTAVGLNGFESVRSYGYRMELPEVLDFVRYHPRPL